jgi:hypothetical protein
MLNNLGQSASADLPTRAIGDSDAYRRLKFEGGAS